MPDGERNLEPIESKMTSQGQVSIPARIRRKLGLTAGSKVEWCERGDEVVVRRASKYSSLDIHKAVFAGPPVVLTAAGVRADVRTSVARMSVEDMDEGIRAYMRRTHARR